MSHFHKLALQFVDELLRDAKTTPEEDFSRLTNRWREVTSANWTWMCIRNSYTNRWSIVDASSNGRSPLPDTLAEPASDKETLFDLVVKTESPFFSNTPFAEEHLIPFRDI